MSLKVIKTKGNIFDTKADVICNAVNCIGVMGAGVAKALPINFLKCIGAIRTLVSLKWLILVKAIIFICPMKIIGK